MCPFSIATGSVFDTTLHVHSITELQEQKIIQKAGLEQKGIRELM